MIPTWRYGIGLAAEFEPFCRITRNSYLETQVSQKPDVRIVNKYFWNNLIFFEEPDQKLRLIVSCINY